MTAPSPTDARPRTSSAGSPRHPPRSARRATSSRPAGSSRAPAASSTGARPPRERPEAGVAPPATATSGTPASGGLAERAQQLLVTAIDKLAAVAAGKVEELAGKLDDVAANGGVGMNAALQGGLAKLQGKNPVWAAIKGGVAAMSTSTKILVALGLILSAVLAPVLVLVLAIVLLIAAVAGAVAS